MNQQMPDVIVTPLRTGLLAGADNDLHLLIQVRAPQAPASIRESRPALNLALVVDRSGSMAGKNRCTKRGAAPAL